MKHTTISTASALASLSALLPGALAHGYVSGILAGGKYYQGYDPHFVYYNPPPQVAGWTIDDVSGGFVSPTEYTTDSAITCHHSAKAAPVSIPVVAGSAIELQWTAWPETHHGPIINYLAPCSGSCSSATTSSLSFFKIDASGLLNATPAPGKWATDALIASNNTYTLTIPAKIKPGNYVLRHEIIALQTGGDLNGSQNYPQCISLTISGSGTVAPPAGVKGTALYKPDDAGIHYDIYNNPTKTYPIPGPTKPASLN